MHQRPAHLTRENASRFQHKSVVARYHLRLAYPANVFDILEGLISAEARSMLDVGTGTGELARPMAARGVRVDALDLSPGMIERARALPGSDADGIRWLVGAAEDAAIEGPYGLIVAGDSLHWMHWEVVMPRFARALEPGAWMTMVHREDVPPAWHDDLQALIVRHSTSQNYRPFDLFDELGKRSLFTVAGNWESEPVPMPQSVDDYLGALHSRSSLSYEAMDTASAKAFDAAVREVVAPFANAGLLDLVTQSTVTWGTPHDVQALAKAAHARWLAD